MDSYPFRKECFQIIGCAMGVHGELGHGFLEAVYQEALALEMQEKKIPFEKEKVLDINYKNLILSKKYVADFICYQEIILELKATETITEKDIYQVLNYLKATRKKIGLLINFGSKSLQYRRVILSGK